MFCYTLFPTISKPIIRCNRHRKWILLKQKKMDIYFSNSWKGSPSIMWNSSFKVKSQYCSKSINNSWRPPNLSNHPRWGLWTSPLASEEEKAPWAWKSQVHIAERSGTWPESHIFNLTCSTRCHILSNTDMESSSCSVHSRWIPSPELFYMKSWQGCHILD